MAKRSGYQERIIRNYYQNRDALMVQKLSEMVADLYLSEGKARQRLWTRIETVMKNLKIPDDQIAHLVQSDNPALVADLVKRLMES